MTDQELVEHFYAACAEFNKTTALMIAAGIKTEVSITYSDSKVVSETVRIKEITPVKAEKMVVFDSFKAWREKPGADGPTATVDLPKK